MSFERPGRGMLVFQCDVCFESYELSRADVDTEDFSACWAILRDAGWSREGSDHFCEDCAKTARSDRANPFRPHG
jgi:hypothetical protein